MRRLRDQPPTLQSSDGALDDLRNREPPSVQEPVRAARGAAAGRTLLRDRRARARQRVLDRDRRGRFLKDRGMRGGMGRRHDSPFRCLLGPRRRDSGRQLSLGQHGWPRLFHRHAGDRRRPGFSLEPKLKGAARSTPRPTLPDRFPGMAEPVGKMVMGSRSARSRRRAVRLWSFCWGVGRQTSRETR